jgi:hypothetical protein
MAQVAVEYANHVAILMPMGGVNDADVDADVDAGGDVVVDAVVDSVVEEALAPVRDITQLPVADHVEAFTDTHQRLRNLLTSSDDDPTAA